MSAPNWTDLGTNATSAEAREQLLRIQDLAPGDRLVIRTDHTAYHLAVIEPAARQVVLWGGPLFPNPVGVQLDGCSRNGRFLEVGGICLGCSLEFRTSTGTIVTGAVQSIGVVHHG